MARGGNVRNVTRSRRGYMDQLFGDAFYIVLQWMQQASRVMQKELYMLKRINVGRSALPVVIYQIGHLPGRYSLCGSYSVPTVTMGWVPLVLAYNVPMVLGTGFVNEHTAVQLHGQTAARGAETPRGARPRPDLDPRPTRPPTDLGRPPRFRQFQYGFR